MTFKNTMRLTLAALFLLVGFAIGARAATPEEAQAMADKAAALVKAEGEKAFPKISDQNGEFVKGDLFVTVIDKQGVVRANQNSRLVGVNMWEATDPDGVKITQLSWTATEKSNTAWITFKFTNQASKKIEPKKTWVHRVGDYVVQSGVYITP